MSICTGMSIKGGWSIRLAPFFIKAKALFSEDYGDRDNRACFMILIKAITLDTCLSNISVLEGEKSYEDNKAGQH